MQNYLLHLWAPPPVNLRLEACPAPPPGEPVPPPGLYAADSVAAAFSLTGWISVVTIVLLVLLTYLLQSGSLSERFVKKWWGMLAIAVLLCAVIALVVLRVFPTHAMAGTCPTNPTAFAAPLPWNVIVDRAIAGAAWGSGAFTLLSIVLTRTLGYWPGAKGFFHFRGCPWPRFKP